MSKEHKLAIRQGRMEASAVKAYLDSIATSSGKARTADPSAIQRRLKATEEKLAKETSSLKQVELIQQKLNLENALRATKNATEESKLEEEFIKAAGAYGRRKGISYRAWRAVGVPARVLREAGISRTD